MLKGGVEMKSVTVSRIRITAPQPQRVGKLTIFLVSMCGCSIGTGDVVFDVFSTQYLNFHYASFVALLSSTLPILIILSSIFIFSSASKRPPLIVYSTFRTV